MWVNTTGLFLLEHATTIVSQNITGVYLLKLLHVLLHFLANICSCSEFVRPFFQDVGLHFFVVRLQRINAARIQCRFELGLQTLIFCFQLLILSDEPFNFILLQRKIMLLLSQKRHTVMLFAAVINCF